LTERNAGYERFRDALIDGRIGLGASLTQSELCVILGMSLSPMRETMTLLQHEGLITVRKRSGVQVFAPNVDFFRANFQMRTLIEKEAVKRYARSAPLAALGDLIEEHDRCIADMGQARDASDFVPRVSALEDGFHFSIANAFENQVMAEAHRRAYSNMRLFRIAHPVPYTLDSQSAALREHVKVLRCCLERNSSGAHDALDEHFRSVMNRVFGSD
jgi:DNA-binding GntR family transcriptional regulator